MRLEELECKGCGAKLHVEEGDNSVTCPYCRITYHVDDGTDAQNSGYEFEKGRIKAQQEHAEKQRAAAYKMFENQKTTISIYRKFVVGFMIFTAVLFVIILFTRLANAGGIFGSTKNKVSKDEVRSFNFLYDNGTQYGSTVENRISEIITNNKTNSRKIRVRYKNYESDNPTEISKIKSMINTGAEKYEISLDYDSDGFITVYIIEDIKEEQTEKKVDSFEVLSFNNYFNKGIQEGYFVQTRLDYIYNNNKDNARKVKVKYKGIETDNNDEIYNIKKSIDKKKEYDISLEYDSDGFVNLYLIEEKQ